MMKAWPDRSCERGVAVRGVRRRMQPSKLLGVGLVALCLSTAGNASAQSKEELDRARVLFREGVALSAANNCAAALGKFQEVSKVKMTAQVAFNIGECEERLGKLVEALGNYRVAASMAADDKRAKDVAAKVGERVEALEARIPKLTIKRGEGADTATIELDGVELGASQISTELPVNPGSHVVTGKVDGKEYLKETVSLEEKENKTFEVTIELPKQVEKPIEQTKPDQPPPPPKGGSKVPGAVVLGLGIASGVVSGVFWGLRGGALSDLDTMCGGDSSCPPSAQDTADQGKLYTGVAEATALVGVAGIVTGIVLLATSGPSAPKKQDGEGDSTQSKRGMRFVASAPGASVGGFSLVGRF